MRQMAAGSSVKEQRVAVDTAVSLQLWRATGLAPKALQCPRHVFSCEPDCEPSTSAPPVDSIWFRVPQSSQCFYNGPIDTLPSYQQGGQQGSGLSRRPSRAAPPQPPAPTHTGKQPRNKSSAASRGGSGATTSAAAASAWNDPPDHDENDPLSSLISQCSRRQRTLKSRRPRQELMLLWLDKPSTVSFKVNHAAGKGSKGSLLPQRRTSQQQQQATAVASIELLNAGGSSGGSISSGTTSFGAVILDAKGQPLSPSSPLSEWRG